MPTPEAALLDSAGGVFWATLIAFLIISIVAVFIYMMKKLLDQNGKFNDAIVAKMGDIVKEIQEDRSVTIQQIKDYKIETCNALALHDAQAKEILRVDNETSVILKSRPCIKDK